MKKEPVIFLDRDGTINKEITYLYKPEDLQILPDVPEAISMFNTAGYKVILITNQAGVGRGYYTERDVEHLHHYLNEKLGESKARIDGFYYCPHHPVHGIGEYLVTCDCRKPGIGMFERAETQVPVDKEQSWMIGDKLIDVQAGKAYGIRTVLVGTGYGKEAREQAENLFAATGKETQMCYDVFAETLLDAAKIIIGRKKE